MRRPGVTVSSSLAKTRRFEVADGKAEVRAVDEVEDVHPEI